MMDGDFGDEAQDVDGSGGEGDAAPASVAFDLANDENSDDDVDQVLNELPKSSTVAPPPEKQGVKRKRGRPTKAESMARKVESASKVDNNSHRRSGRIVAKVRSETKNDTAAQPAKRERPKKVSPVCWCLIHLIVTDVSGRCF